ncbi:hypothetical protein HNR07_006243 [Nocardiopsis metallicus]|uniref:Uncharacterized protein n=1 Tax=Nocardiopsis metallicus TaxID=179819 RepID=A0A840WU63_9ACTN|nr:hypothetical protein [Nocardiopsis metallicus]
MFDPDGCRRPIAGCVLTLGYASPPPGVNPLMDRA